MKWAVRSKSSGALLGVIVKYRKNVGTLKNPCWRVRYCLEGNEAVKADTRSCLAVYLAGGSGYTMETL